MGLIFYLLIYLYGFCWLLLFDVLFFFPDSGNSCAFQTGRQIDWAHLVRYQMHKAVRANALLPYPYLVTLFLHHFNIALDDEPFVKVKRSFSIGAGAVTSFGYRKYVDGLWVRKQDLPPPIPNERTPSPPPQRVDSSSL